jgi:diguanylate cyclase (GGDEF)-like protein/PAS domain S-box-containing protein
MNPENGFNSLFAPETEKPAIRENKNSLKLLMVDDEPDIHTVLRLALQGVKVEGQAIELLEAHSFKEAKEVLSRHPDIALILLDVVMETNQAGLELVNYVRKELLNHNIQLILLTGQPGYAPQKEVITQYEINAYMLKPEMTSEKIFSTVYSSLRSYILSTELETQRKKLEISEQQYFDLYDNSPDMYVSVDAETATINKCNQTLANKLGYSKAEIEGRSMFELYHADSLEGVKRAFASFVSTGVVNNAELQLKRKDGSKVDVNLNVTAIRDKDGQIKYSRCCWIDISERIKMESRLQLAGIVFSHANEGITITDADASILETNEAFSRITGYSHDEVIGKNPRILQSGLHNNQFYAEMWDKLLQQGNWSGEVWNRRKSGEVYAEMLNINAVRNAEGKIQNYIALFSDITAQKEHQKQLEHIAHYDALTNLPNRVLLADRLEQSMVQEIRRNKKLAVIYLDLDEFKQVNDSHGHHMGDRLLVELSKRFKAALRDGDTIARIGGDEFVIVLNDLSNQMDSMPILERLIDAAAKSVKLDQLEFLVSASMGVTFYPQNEMIDADQLLRQADQSMYQAKLAGKNRYHFFDADQDQSIRGKHETLQRISRALSEEEFVLYYQPKINMHTGKMIGVEALIRWQHPQRGILSPVEFLPIIEDNPIAIEVGNWVLKTAIAQIDNWHRNGLKVSVSVNVGSLQLESSDFVGQLEYILSLYPELDKSCLELEVLETSAMNDISLVSRVINDCKAIGVSFALDDFGTGYSSLTYLKRLPAATIKIDQTFVMDMLNVPEDIAILKGIIGLAHAFNLEVIAEGVETIEHAKMLIDLGCVNGQGYAFAKPMSAEELLQWFDFNKSHPVVV